MAVDFPVQICQRNLLTGMEQAIRTHYGILKIMVVILLQVGARLQLALMQTSAIAGRRVMMDRAYKLLLSTTEMCGTFIIPILTDKFYQAIILT